MTSLRIAVTYAGMLSGKSALRKLFYLARQDIGLGEGRFFFVSRRIASRRHEISDLKKSSRAQSSGRMHEVESTGGTQKHGRNAKR